MSRTHTKSKKTSPASASPRQQKLRRQNSIWLWAGLGVLVIVFAGFLLFAPKPTPSVEISPIQAYDKYQLGAFFLDVRTQDEFNQFHIKGSTLIPLDELPNRLSELSKDKDIVVICLSGHRSLSGTNILQQAGFTHVYCLKGGLQAWMDANYPVEKGN